MEILGSFNAILMPEECSVHRQQHSIDRYSETQRRSIGVQPYTYSALVSTGEPFSLMRGQLHSTKAIRSEVERRRRTRSSSFAAQRRCVDSTRLHSIEQCCHGPEIRIPVQIPGLYTFRCLDCARSCSLRKNGTDCAAGLHTPVLHAIASPLGSSVRLGIPLR